VAVTDHVASRLGETFAERDVPGVHRLRHPGDEEHRRRRHVTEAFHAQIDPWFHGQRLFHVVADGAATRK
jgi:hypothetical protein